MVAAKAGPDERRTIEADPGRGGPRAADECAQVDVPGGWRCVLPDRLGEFLARDGPAALADQIGERHPALATSELRLEEQLATRLQTQPAGDVDADAHSQSETDLCRRALRIRGSRRFELGRQYGEMSTRPPRATASRIATATLRWRHPQCVGLLLQAPLPGRRRRRGDRQLQCPEGGTALGLAIVAPFQATMALANRTVVSSYGAGGRPPPDRSVVSRTWATAFQPAQPRWRTQADARAVRIRRIRDTRRRSRLA